MTDLKFKVNGVDFSDVVKKYGYTTRLTPVVYQYTDLDKIQHTTKIRDIGSLTITLNASLEGRIAELCEELLNYPCEVQYHSFQRGADVSETMMPDATTITEVMKRGTKRWAEVSEITFTQQ